jgi:hypothetical protein
MEGDAPSAPSNPRTRNNGFRGTETLQSGTKAWDPTMEGGGPSTPSKNQPIVKEWKSGDGIFRISLRLNGTTRRSSCWLRFAPKTAGQFLRGRKHLISCARRGGRLVIGGREDSSSCRITCMSFAALRSGLRGDWRDGSVSGKQRCRALGSGPKSSRSGSKISGIDRCGQVSITATGGSTCGKTPFAPV